jgi:enoyl-CoA hydratase/carnithine racemase
MQASEFRDVSYSVDEKGIATLAFDTPKRKNAMSPLTTLEAWWAVDQFEKDDSAFVMILTGVNNPENDDPKKQAFCSGGYFAPDAMEGISDEVMKQIDQTDIAQKRLTLKLFQCDKPVLGAINGLAIGGGATLILAGTDQIYMSEHAWMQFPFANLGIAAELGSTYFLPRLLGFQKAKEILFFPERISAESAVELGICNKVVPHDELMAYTRSQAEKLIPPHGAALSIRAMKRCMHEPKVAELSAALDLENEALLRLFPAPDFAEALAARMERRPPVFTGKAS